MFYVFTHQRDIRDTARDTLAATAIYGHDSGCTLSDSTQVAEPRCDKWREGRSPSGPFRVRVNSAAGGTRTRFMSSIVHRQVVASSAAAAGGAGLGDGSAPVGSLVGAPTGASLA